MDPNQMGVAGQPVPNQPTMSNMPEFGVQPQAQAAAVNQPIAQPVAQPAAQPMPEQMVPTETLSIEQQMEAAMREPVMETPAPAPMPVEAPKKKGHGMVICLIAALLVAAGGIGFGIYMMISGQQTEDKYKKQISSLQTTINQLQSASEDDEVDEEGNPLSVSDYFYLPDLGIKVKKSTDWQNTVNVVEFYNGYPQAVNEYAIEERNDSGDALLSRVHLYEQCTESSTACIEIDDTKVGVSVGPNVTETFKAYYTNPENYSAI